MIRKILTVILAVSVAVLIAVTRKNKGHSFVTLMNSLIFMRKGYKYAPFNRYQHG